MGDGVRPKGAKSYAAMRSAEAMEAHRKDIADPRRCPKCGGEMEYAIGKKGTIAEGIEEWYCPTCGFIDGEDECGHEEKVR